MSNLAALPIDSEMDSVTESQPNSLAVQVEQARQTLLELLLENKQTNALIINRFLHDLNSGVDCSDLIVAKNSEDYKRLLQLLVNSQAASRNNQVVSNENNGQDKVVQADNVVQLMGSEFAQQSLIARSVNRLLYSLHLLPVFLLDSAAQADGVLSADTEDSADFKKRLGKAKRELRSLRQQMISANTGLVAFVAHKYKTSNLSFEDLMQEGLVGLIKAVDRFDPDRGICFSTYAIYWIRQAISRLIVKQEKIVRLPVALAEKSATVFEAMRTCYLKYERWPSIAELKMACDLSEQEIKTISSYYQATHSLDAAIGDDDDNLELMAKMQQHQFSLPLDELIDQDLAQYVDKAVASLPEKQAAILTMRFGLRDHTEMTLQAVADQLHVTRERVRQIQNEALKKLKQQFGFDLMLFLEPKDG
ncbi:MULTISPECIES: sigma-70 family RNA polymerase sigma factor [Methylomonas]|uniref:RNA polymerase subunit sigma-32 n=2 Tax=Methylomonas TaxID=416 RepID=A0A126T8J7_9GAMM|nr:MULTISPECIES: sigma-70 family RNA polymerase sigma factor [Methylomonas]AMK78419.1 RNA polymerase subunit sigma-32 [Methylomonas denitrificans]OAI04123.1 RNA polymerase subunit sigma-32 [Methylomonas methanica]TCV87551.1 RNA polymerase primary sigma factor [Methylomonas methanica]